MRIHEFTIAGERAYQDSAAEVDDSHTRYDVDVYRSIARQHGAVLEMHAVNAHAIAAHLSQIVSPWLPVVVLPQVTARDMQPGWDPDFERQSCAFEYTPGVTAEWLLPHLPIQARIALVHDAAMGLHALGRLWTQVAPRNLRVGFRGGVWVLPATPPSFMDIVSPWPSSSVQHLLGVGPPRDGEAEVTGVLRSLVAGLRVSYGDHFPEYPYATLAERLRGEFDLDDGRVALSGVAAQHFGQLRAEQVAAVLDAASRLDTQPAVLAVPTRRISERALWADTRLVTVAEFEHFARKAGLARAPGAPPSGDAASQAVTFVSQAHAQAYCLWRGGRLPAEPEWLAFANEPWATDHSRAWEWTCTRFSRGFLVRGGRYRDLHTPASTANRSWEDSPAPDVGFRCFYDAPPAPFDFR